ncbi:hypothetical protein [uncultured Sphingomonas sp.]|uniref:hypothetical protein n=1 Tax=uncultured Sphingomonas sp. TaxID=158754 RepID=UPI0035CA122C
MVSESRVVDAGEFAELLLAELMEIGRANGAETAELGPEILLFEPTVQGFSEQFRGAVDLVVRRYGITGLRIRSDRNETHEIVDRLLPGVRARNLERKIQQMIDIVAD